MKKSESRASFIFGAIPHSVLRRTKQIKNPTASALLLLLAERTFAFRKGSVDLTYRKISQELGVTWRTISTAARRLQDQGDLIRKKLPGKAYRWWIPLNPDEVIADPEQRFCIRETGEPQTPSPDRSIISPPDRSIIPPMINRSGEQAFEEQAKGSSAVRLEDLPQSVDKSPLKKVFKDKDLKKKQQEACSRHGHPSSELTSESKPERAARSTNVDEPLHKICLRKLCGHGVSQRVARQLCRDNEHSLIQSVLETVPELSGVKNVAGYLVTAIRDGGYETLTSDPEGKKNAPQVTGRRSNYAHLTDNNIKPERHRYVKDSGDAPIAYRTVEETRQENQSLEVQRVEREAAYRNEGQNLAQRFMALSDNVKERLKTLASAHLEDLVPMSGKRDEMLQDRTFQRVANRTVLEQFFEWVDLGVTPEQALVRI